MLSSCYYLIIHKYKKNSRELIIQRSTRVAENSQFSVIFSSRTAARRLFLRNRFTLASPLFQPRFVNETDVAGLDAACVRLLQRV